MLNEMFFLQNSDIGKGSCARDRITTKGTQVLARLEAVSDSCGSNKGPQRKAVGDAFCQCHNIGFNTLLVLNAEEFASATKACLYLINHQQDAIAIQDFFDPSQIALWEWD